MSLLSKKIVRGFRESYLMEQMGFSHKRIMYKELNTLYYKGKEIGTFKRGEFAIACKQYLTLIRKNKWSK